MTYETITNAKFTNRRTPISVFADADQPRDFWISTPRQLAIARIRTPSKRWSPSAEYKAWAERLIAALPAASIREIAKIRKSEPVSC